MAVGIGIPIHLLGLGSSRSADVDSGFHMVNMKESSMGQETLDCRGLACPNPVLRTKALIEKGDTDRVTVLVDNAAAGENVSRFLGRTGYSVEISDMDGVFHVVGLRKESTETVHIPSQDTKISVENKIAVMVATDRMGRGDDVLGSKLMFNFIETLKEMGQELWRLVLVNAGVKLAVEGSESLPALIGLEREGVTILVCGTCLNHFNLLERKKIGETTNMLDIVTALQLADKVISLS